jgi:hypothetical protein
MARVCQERWLVYQDGQDEVVMAVVLGWYHGHNPQAPLEQELVAGGRAGHGSMIPVVS